MLPALINKLVTVNRGGYQLLDSVLPETVDSVVTRYATEDGQSGYLRYKSGLLIQWIVNWGTYPSTTNTPKSWQVNFFEPYKNDPVVVSGFKSGWISNTQGGVEDLSTTGVGGYFLTQNPAAVNTVIAFYVFAIGY